MSDTHITESELLAQGIPPDVISELLPDAHTGLLGERCWPYEFVQDRLALLRDRRTQE
jgi:hypothetical protein